MERKQRKFSSCLEFFPWEAPALGEETPNAGIRSEQNGSLSGVGSCGLWRSEIACLFPALLPRLCLICPAAVLSFWDTLGTV